MPGHIKLKKGAEEPDPSEFLFPSQEIKRADQQKYYDAKKSVWIPDPKTGGFREGLLEEGSLEEPGSKCIIGVAHEKFTFKAEEIGKVNPPKFEKCEDMVNLTFLNDASVFWNLKTRYECKLIHTYSGLFVVVVNPYKRYPLYTYRCAKIYLGKRRNEVPPHLWAIAEGAFRGMLGNTKDQAMLITGESGAGKTENTKKVITYLAIVASSSKKSEKKVSLEDQIVATNPILESYGNAKTARNDNSSRFGKFIRIHFNAYGKLAGCDIVSYLLEKSRITEQQEVERSYHIFYQLLQKFHPDMQAKCLCSNDAYDYSYISQGKITVLSIDDFEECEYTLDAFNVLGFGEENTWNCLKVTAGVMACGEIVYHTKGRDDQAENDHTKEGHVAWKVATLWGVDAVKMIKAFCKPRIKVGTEWVSKGQTCEQATISTGGVARGVYDRLFKWLIEMCNETLVDNSMKKANFCAVLDIAGFEIFDYNGFEQISINFVNEKLQQFFNHHMFVVEQEEYVKEGIDWAMVDFGMDLQACIVMFEKPMGIWAILEEESLFPKATDKSFEEKLKASLGKLTCFLKTAKSATDKNAHFACIHYAGIVSYNVTGWLEKNKDPVNETVIQILKEGSNELMVHLWRNHPGQPSEITKDEGKKKKKSGGGKTVSSVYLVSLSDLMSTLHTCEPHFVRCLVPNTHKKPGDIDPPLIMHQLTCNGVLEGIRICMRGFPNRMFYTDFKSRYSILAEDEILSSNDNKTAVYALMDKVGFSRERYRLGHTLVFFRAGALAILEEVRDDIVLRWLRCLQGQCLKHIRNKVYAKKYNQRYLLVVTQRSLRRFMCLRNWGWFIIIQKIRPLIGQPNPEEELRILEQRAKDKYGAYEEQLETKARIEEKNVAIEEEKAALIKELESKQGDISQYHEKHTKVADQKAILEATLHDTQNKLAQAEKSRTVAAANKKQLEQETALIKKDMDEIELSIKKLEQEKTNRDHTIHLLNDEIANKDETLNKLNKEKKRVAESAAKGSDDLQVAEEKLGHLNSIKSKLESTLYELERSLDNEKRGRADVEKTRRKIQGELNIAQETVANFERSKKESEGTIARKEKEAIVLFSKLENEQSLVVKVQKQIKENQSRVEELEEELEAERQSRSKAERQRADLTHELEGLGDRINEASGATAAQIELNKKREAEVAKLRRDLEEAHIQQEATVISLKKKQQDAITEMTEQIEALNKIKTKFEKDKTYIMHEIGDIRTATDEIYRSKVSAEKSHKSLVSELHQVSKRVEEARLNLENYDATKKKIVAENSDLLRQLQELENNKNILSKFKSSLATQFEEQKLIADNEAKERQSLFSKFHNAEHELEGMHQHLDEEISAKDNIARQFNIANDEADIWSKKYEKDGVVKAEELEMAKLKIQARLAEGESTIDQLNANLTQLEKSKEKLQAEIDDMNSQLDKAQILNSSMEKRAKQMDIIVGHWKGKVDSMTMELDNNQKETRIASAELFRVKSAYDESVLQLDEFHRENKSLSNEIKDIMDQISEGGRSIHELDKICKRLQAEKMELEAALGDAEGALEQEENKHFRSQLEVTQLKEAIARRLSEKDEEFESTKKNFGKAIEGMQAAIDVESKGKAEAFCMRKKLEADVLDLDISLDHANAANQETQRNLKNLHDQIRATQTKLEDEQRTKAASHEQLLNADRKAHANANALEEARTLLDQADRARRIVEKELADTNETLSEQTCLNQSIAGAKRKLENEMQTLAVDFDEITNEAAKSEEKAQRAMIDAARIAEELRAEQDTAQELERERKFLDTQAKDMQFRLDDAEQNALKGGKKAMGKLEGRIRELESELDAENRRLGDAQKNTRKSDRKIKELTFQGDEDRKNHERMQALIDQLQAKIKTYKKQIEEAEEIAALNLSKFRQVQNSLAESTERADHNERLLARTKAKGRESLPPV